ncbi:MAG: two-component regulator propeller domain-containing protein [Saonia sp.]
MRHILQDDTGFLWLGTFSGLNRFDGYQFKSYLSAADKTNTINNDDITALELDQDNNHLWIGTRNGLTLFELDKKTFTTFLPEKDNPQSLPDNEIRSVHIDKFKRIWVGTKTKGLYLFNTALETFSKIEIDGFYYVKEIFEDKKGNIWAGSYGTASVAKIILTNDGSVGQIVQYDLAIPSTNTVSPYINFIYEDHKSDIFVGTREGLFLLDQIKNSFTHLEIENKEIKENLGPYFVSVARAPDGKYWVGTLGGLLVCNQLEDIAKGDFEWYYTILSDDTSLVNNLISALYFDPSGVLWIGTEDGLDKYDPYENQFKLNKDISTFISNQVPRLRGFSKTYDGKLIVATRHNGLFISNENSFRPLYNGSHDIASIYSDDGYTFFCGLWDGKILVYDYLKKSSRILDVGFKKSAVLAFLKLENEKIIIGSFGEGAVVIDKKTLKADSSFGHLLNDSSINKIIKDENSDTIWFATEDGVVRYAIHTSTEKVYKANSLKQSGLPHDNVSDVIIDNDKRIWAATRLGLAYHDKHSDDFIKLNQPESLEGEWITDMALDADGVLWLNMNNNNIAKFQNKSGVGQVQIFHVNSGNRLDVFSSSGFYHFDDSMIYLAGKNGVISFSPYTLEEELWSPKPFITDFKVQNKEVYHGIEINNQKFLTSGPNFDNEIELKYKNRNFSLQFSSPSYSNQRQNRYQYMLDGFNDNWILANSNSRTVQYTNLYPGDYTFRLRASNSNGYWSEEASYKIKVLSPFWLTYKALFLALFVISILVYVVQGTIKERIRLRQELLSSKLKQERNKKLNDEKLRFFTNISHELRTPLTLILGPAKDLIQQAKENNNDYLNSRSQLIHQNANRLLQLVNQILDFRKAQTGGLDLKVAQTNILRQSKMVFESFKELSKNKSIHYHFNCEDDTLFGWIDKEKYDKILYNLLSNAIKFTKKHGNVDLYVGFNDKSKEHLIVEVSDDGIGIPKASQKNIFSRFYQARNGKESTTGSGIGLSLVKYLVERHKGEITFVSSPNDGTIFKMKLPIGKNCYEDNEINRRQVHTIVEEVPSAASKKRLINTTQIKQKLLIIEDNAELRNYLVDYLSDYYKVYSAENGKDGLQLCQQLKPILCISDVMMPVMNGIKFCKELKNDESISHIPVILLTALSENNDKAMGYDAGADGYLVKPFDPSLLKTRIANIINSRRELKAKFSAETESEVSLLTHSPIDEEFMQKVITLIDLNLAESKLTTSFLCQELGMSSSKLYRKMKELTDLAPNEFIRTVRLKKAAVLLRTRRHNVSEVSDMTGFNDPLYFSRCFRKQFGFPPSNLIKNPVITNS